MGTCGFYMVTAAIISITVLVNILEVYSGTNLQINGNQVFGESFKLVCYTRTTDTASYAAFFRSTNLIQLGIRVVYRRFEPDQTPSCLESTSLQTNYTISCNSNGSMFTLTIPANNTIEHKTYWRCRTNTDYIVMDNNVIAIVIKHVPPRPPLIVGFSNATVYEAILGRLQSVTCQVPIDHPVPTLSWSCPSYTVTGTTPLPGATDVVSSSITWTATSIEIGQKCQCTSYQAGNAHLTTYFIIDVLWRTHSSPEGSITGPVIGALVGGIVIGVLVVLGTLHLRSHWRDKGPEEDNTQSSAENQLSTEDQGTPVHTYLDLNVTPPVDQDEQYQDLTPDRSASTSEYQTLDTADTGLSDLDS